MFGGNSAKSVFVAGTPTVLHSTVQYSTVQYSTVQYCAAKPTVIGELVETASLEVLV